jgi:hypothetical protein
MTTLMNASVINIPVSLSLESSDTISVNVSVNTAATTGVRGVDYSFDDTVITWLPYTMNRIEPCSCNSQILPGAEC